MSESLSALQKALDNQITFLCMLNIYLMGETNRMREMGEILMFAHPGQEGWLRPCMPICHDMRLLGLPVDMVGYKTFPVIYKRENKSTTVKENKS